MSRHPSEIAPSTAASPTPADAGHASAATPRRAAEATTDTCPPQGITRTWVPTPGPAVRAFFAAMPQLTLPGIGEQADDIDPTPPAGTERRLRLIQGGRS